MAYEVLVLRMKGALLVAISVGEMEICWEGLIRGFKGTCLFYFLN